MGITFQTSQNKIKNDSYRRDNRKNKWIVGQNNPNARALVKQQNAPLLKIQIIHSTQLTAATNL